MYPPILLPPSQTSHHQPSHRPRAPLSPTASGAPSTCTPPTHQPGATLVRDGTKRSPWFGGPSLATHRPAVVARAREPGRARRKQQAHEPEATAEGRTSSYP
ncbi:hypothetical protein BKA56DRAFT_585210 [Ilyonectria sp. MPI-CAGE-AT-0026]|nr:hypothetical protein BKA56DRAFT_585210 [Ilyonectria sp. MPI-CAGE-AT-0026]